jgi:hypothetical protein
MNDSSNADPKRELLRHILATLAYRGAKVIRDAPETFGEFNGAGRTPRQILAHLGDLMDWSLALANGKREWHEATPLPWNGEVERFFAAVKSFDDYIASAELLHAPIEQLVQGPVADALTHVGQLAMLRRMAGAAIRGENYFAADIVVGRVGVAQTEPKRKN